MEASIKKNISIIPAKPAYDRSIRPQMRTLRVAAYCRVSTLMEQQESSYEAQVQYYTRKSKAIRTGNWQGFMQMTERARQVPEKERISSP